MAGYYDDFLGSTLGSPATGWTQSGDTTNSPQLKVVETTSNVPSFNGREAAAVVAAQTTAHFIFSNDAASADINSDNMEVLASLRFPYGPTFDSSTTGFSGGVAARATFAGTTVAGAYVTVIYMNNGCHFRVYKIVSGTATQVGSTYDLPSTWLQIPTQGVGVSQSAKKVPLQDVYFNVRLRCNGTSISATIWPRFIAEPSPQIAATDSSVTGTGAAGLYISTTDPIPWVASDGVAFGTNGDVAILGDTPPEGKVLADRGTAVTVYNYPSAEVDVLSGQTVSPIERQTDDGVQVLMSTVLAVVGGRIARRDQYAWTFTLDEHDFYVLRMGDEATLVYDALTQTWPEWGEDEGLPDGSINHEARWKLATGINWQGIGAVAEELGSNIVVGDDTFGMLYVLDPEYEKDYQEVLEDGRSFRRIAAGQLLASGRNYEPVWGVRLMGAVGQQVDAALTSVSLETSVNAGITYQSHGAKICDAGDYFTRLDWLSLGSMTNPGMLFKIIDDGALARIDSLESYDAES